MNIKELIKKFFNWPFLRFAIVGGINTLVGASIMFLLYNLAGCSYWVSSAANYIFSSILSYFLNKYFTFRKKGRSWKHALKFALNIIVCYLIAYGLAKPLTARIFYEARAEIRENAAMLVGLVLCAIMNYFGQKLFVFGSDDKEKEKEDKTENKKEY